jgi:hypothetical protein
MSPPVWVPGQVLASADVNSWFVPLVAYKTSDQNVASSTTLVNDTALFLPVAANAFYWFQSVLQYKGGTSGSSDMKWQWNVPSGATLRYAANYLSAAFSVQVGDGKVAGVSYAAGTNGTTNPFTVQVSGHLAVGATAGNLQLQWAQNTSNGTATTVGQSSVVMLTRIG